MMKSLKGGRQAPGKDSGLTVDEVRLLADLRIMHSKVDELYQISRVLRTRHNEQSVITYADARVLAEDIRKVDELYLWFIQLKDEAERGRRRVSGR